MKEKSLKVQFRLSGDAAELIRNQARIMNVSENHIAKTMLLESMEEDLFYDRTNLKVGIRQLTIMQRFLEHHLGEEATAKILADAELDENEMLDNLGVNNE